MPVGLTGRERCENEFRALFAAAEFELVQIILTGGEFAVIEARALRR